ncbi:MAG: DUF4114 domain-containing protein [Oscillatoria sp. PMC 1051.18]|nr:DUF4114 domain-containing protein [Oscillatoria sp. PMC 1050.18]MEC5032610.1 DUF4114 domain-containing protein [Oscillatoria sp. PMC 1051.18]
MAEVRINSITSNLLLGSDIDLNEGQVLTYEVSIEDIDLAEGEFVDIRINNNSDFVDVGAGPGEDFSFRIDDFNSRTEDISQTRTLKIFDFNDDIDLNIDNIFDDISEPDRFATLTFEIIDTNIAISNADIFIEDTQNRQVNIDFFDDDFSEIDTSPPEGVIVLDENGNGEYQIRLETIPIAPIFMRIDINNQKTGVGVADQRISLLTGEVVDIAGTENLLGGGILRILGTEDLAFGGDGILDPRIIPVSVGPDDLRDEGEVIARIFHDFLPEATFTEEIEVNDNGFRDEAIAELREILGDNAEIPQDQIIQRTEQLIDRFINETIIDFVITPDEIQRFDRDGDGFTDQVLASTTIQSDPNYYLQDDLIDNELVPTIEVTQLDNDVPAVTITQDERIVTEGGNSATYFVRLATFPRRDDNLEATVIITLTPNEEISLNGANPGEAIRLRFTTDNAQFSQPVVVTALDDATIDPEDIGLITHEITTPDTVLTDPRYAPEANVPFIVNGSTTNEVRFNIEENDEAGIIITQTGETVNIVEGEITDTFEIQLATIPDDEVQIDLIPGAQIDVGDGVEETITLTFTPENYNQPQTVTVSAEDDNVLEGDRVRTISIASFSPDVNYGPGVPFLINGNQVSDITVNITDNDAGAVITTEDPDVAVLEGGDDPGSYQVRLNLQPTANVTLTVTPSSDAIDLGNGAGVPFNLTFTPDNFDTPQTVTFTGVEDPDQEDEIVSLVQTLSSADPRFSGASQGKVSINGNLSDTLNVEILDDDTEARIIVEEISTNEVNLGERELLSYRLRLVNADLEPGETVSVVASRSDQFDPFPEFPTSFPNLEIGGGLGRPVEVTFTADDLIETINVLASNDEIDQNVDPTPGNPNPADRISVIQHAVTSNNPALDDLPIVFEDGTISNRLTVNIFDDDFATVDTSIPDGSLIISEGNSGSYNVRLETIPIIDGDSDGYFFYSIIPSNQNTRIDLPYLTINPETGELVEAQSAFLPGLTETIFRREDPVTGEVENILNAANPGFGDPVDRIIPRGSAALLPENIPLTVGPQDNRDEGDLISLLFHPISTARTLFYTFDSFILSAVDDDDIVRLTEIDPENLQQAILAETADWLFPIDDFDFDAPIDFIDDGDVGAFDRDRDGLIDRFRVSVTYTGDPNYNNEDTPIPTIELRQEDDDEPAVIITEDPELDINEGSEGTYSIRLATFPRRDDSSEVEVEVTLNPNNEIELFDPATEEFAGAGNPVTFTFTTDNALINQDVRVRAIADEEFEGPHTGTIIHTFRSDDPNYNLGVAPILINGAATPLLTVNIDDTNPAVLIEQTDGSTNVSENGLEDTYFVSLSAAPTDDVTVLIQPDEETNLGDGPGNLIILTFSPDNFDSPQAVNIQAVDDEEQEGPHFSTLVHTVTSNDPDYQTAIVGGNRSGTPILIDGEPTEGQSFGELQVNVRDNDVAGVSIFQTEGSSLITEDGATDTFEISLDKRPIADVTVTLDPNGEISLGGGVDEPIGLIFTPENFDEPQIVTVTAFDDTEREDEDNPDPGIVSVTVTSTDPEYLRSTIPVSVDGVAIGQTIDGERVNEFEIEIEDNDTPGVSITQTDESTEVSEAGETDTYDVVLNRQPIAEVTVTITPDQELLLEGANDDGILTLTFTPQDWDIPQTVNVSAFDDSIAEDTPHFGRLIHEVESTDPDYSGEEVDISVDGEDTNELQVAIADNDTPGVSIIQTLGNTEVSEAGDTDIYEIRLDSQPTANVRVTVDPDEEIDLGNGAGVALTLTFTPENFNEAQVVTVQAIEDDDLESDHTGTILHRVNSSDPDYNGADVQFTVFTGENDDEGEPISEQTNQLVVDIEDNDTGDVIINALVGSGTEGIIVSESGGTDSYELRLDSVPEDDVTISVAPSDELDLGRGPGIPVSLTFTPENALNPQTVTVRAFDDNIAQDNAERISRITHTVTSNDPRFNNISIDDASVTIQDNDTARIIASPESGSIAVVEGNETDGYTVRLDTIPEAAVNVTVTPSNAQVDLGNGAGQPVTLTFEADASALDPQTVNVAAFPNDQTNRGDRSATLFHRVTSDDPQYQNFEIPDINVQISDDDTAALNVALEDGNATVVEGGDTDTFSLRLNSVPVSEVTVTVTPDDQVELVDAGEDGTLTLTFTPNNAFFSQEFTVRALNDSLVEGSHTGTVSFSFSSDDPDYNNNDVPINVDGENLGELTVNILDDDAGVAISQTGGNTSVAEGGTSDTYSVVLTTAPVGEVTVILDPDEETDLGNGGGNQVSLVFTEENFDTPQVVNVTGVDDEEVEGEHTSTILHMVSSSDDRYTNEAIAVDGVSTQEITVNVTDNDFGLIVNESDNNTQVVEGGDGDTYTLALSNRPSANVTIELSADDDEVEIEGASGNEIVFTPENFDQPRTISVSVENDNEPEGNRTRIITHTVAEGSAEEYLEVEPTQVEVEVTDDDQIFNRTDNNLFFISEEAGETQLLFTFTERNANHVNEIGYVIADDSQGTINGISPGSEEYVRAAINQGRSIFTALPRTVLQDLQSTRQITFDAGANIVFFLVSDGSIDQVRQDLDAGRETADVFFAIPEANLDGSPHFDVPEVGEEKFTFAWEDLLGGGDQDFNDVLMEVEVANDLPAPRGTGPQGIVELIDLRSPETVEAEFDLNSFAALDNTIGFYIVADTDGTLISGLAPGDEGYAEAAIANNTVRFFEDEEAIPGPLQGLLAPYIISGGTRDEFLDDNPGNELLEGIPVAYFPFLDANPDDSDHIRLLGDNTFGFEDLPNLGDSDFEDYTVQVILPPVETTTT